GERQRRDPEGERQPGAGEHELADDRERGDEQRGDEEPGQEGAGRCGVWLAHTRSVAGASRSCLTVARYCAAMAPSTMRWSEDIVMAMRVPTASWPFLTTGFSTAAPTARMQTLGGLMIAVKCSTPNM